MGGRGKGEEGTGVNVHRPSPRESERLRKCCRHCFRRHEHGRGREKKKKGERSKAESQLERNPRLSWGKGFPLALRTRFQKAA